MWTSYLNVLLRHAPQSPHNLAWGIGPGQAQEPPDNSQG